MASARLSEKTFKKFKDFKRNAAFLYRDNRNILLLLDIYNLSVKFFRIISDFSDNPCFLRLIALYVYQNMQVKEMIYQTVVIVKLENVILFTNFAIIRRKAAVKSEK